MISGEFMGRSRWEGEASAEPKVVRFNSLKLVLGWRWGGGYGGERWRAEAHPTEEEVEGGTGSAALGNGRLPQV